MSAVERLLELAHKDAEEAVRELPPGKPNQREFNIFVQRAEALRALVALLSDPAVIAELFAETLTRKAIIALNAGIDVVLAEYESDGLLPPDMSQFRRLLTQEGGEQAGEASSPPHQNSSGEPATPDLRVEDIENLSHALGVGKHISRERWGYRDHFVPGAADMESMERLRAAGLMDKTHLAGEPDRACFVATTKGRALFGLDLQRPVIRRAAAGIARRTRQGDDGRCAPDNEGGRR